MDHLSLPVSTAQHNEPHSYPAVGPKYGDSGSSLVDPDNCPGCSHDVIYGSSDTFSTGGQSGSNGDNAHPVAEGQIAFANGPAVNKTQVAPKSGAPGPM
jgi:hypothetical protein